MSQLPEQTCGTCRHRGKSIMHEDWTDDGDLVETASRFFLCGLIKHIGMEEHIARAPVGDTPETSYVTDGSGYHAALCVAEDFGCNRWEAGLETKKSPAPPFGSAG